jgi:hypothetical protein
MGGTIVFLILLIIAGAREREPLQRIHFLEADTSGIPGAPNGLCHWTLYGVRPLPPSPLPPPPSSLPLTPNSSAKFATVKTTIASHQWQPTPSTRCTISTRHKTCPETSSNTPENTTTYRGSCMPSTSSPSSSAPSPSSPGSSPCAPTKPRCCRH